MTIVQFYNTRRYFVAGRSSYVGSLAFSISYPLYQNYFIRFTQTTIRYYISSDVKDKVEYEQTTD